MTLNDCIILVENALTNDGKIEGMNLAQIKVFLEELNRIHNSVSVMKKANSDELKFLTEDLLCLLEIKNCEFIKE